MEYRPDFRCGEGREADGVCAPTRWLLRIARLRGNRLPLLAVPVFEVEPRGRDDAPFVIEEVQLRGVNRARGPKVYHDGIARVRRPLARPAVGRVAVVPVVAIDELRCGGALRGERRGNARVVCTVVVDRE